MLVMVIGLALGVILGYFVPINYPQKYSILIAMMILVCLNSLLESFVMMMKKEYVNVKLFWSLITNIVLAIFFTFVGQKIGLSFYYIPTIYLGLSIFKNCHEIKEILINSKIEKSKKNID